MPKYQLDTVAELPDFDALRGYVGRSVSVCISGEANPGLFTYDETDTSSADDGANTIVANNGKRWIRISASPSVIEAAVVPVAAISDEIVALAAVADDIPTVAAVADDVAAVGPIAANVTTVATNVADVSTVADDIANVNIVAANIANVNQAMASGSIYADTTAGLAAVSSGEYFYVPSTVDGESLILYKDNAGTAQEITRLYGVPDEDYFPGTRSLYGPIFTPRIKDLAASNFASDFPADANFTVTAGTANDYTAAIDGLVVGQPFIIYVWASEGTLGTITFTHNGAKTMSDVRGFKVWEGTAEATTATIVIKNGSASATMSGYCRYAFGAVATGDDPEQTADAVQSFFDAGMPVSNDELLRANPVVQTGYGVPYGTSFLALEATSALVTVTTAVSSIALGDFVDVLAYVGMLNGDPGAMADIQYRVTATSEVIYSLFPLAEHPGWWYRRIYLDPAAYTGGTITLVRTNANNKSNSNFYNETARYVTFYVYKGGLPKFYASAAPDEGKGIQRAGNMRSRTYSTTSADEYTGYLKALYGAVRRLWIRSEAGGDYLVVRKDPDTGDFIGDPISITHPGNDSGNDPEWQDFTSSIPVEWKRPHESGFVVGIAPDASGTPGLVEYASSVVGDPALNATSWKSGTADGDDLTLFGGVGERLVGIYVEAEEKPGAVQRMGPMPLTRYGPADYLLVFVIGQSGWEGYAQRPDSYPDYSQIVPAASLMWSRSQSAFVPLHDPCGQNNPTGGSPWPAFAKEIETLMKSRSIILINTAFGGTSIANDWWSSSTGAKAKWTQALADYDSALDAAHAANLPISGAVVLGDLGEGDGLLGTSAATFKAHMVSWLVQIRNLIGSYVPIFWRPPGRGNPSGTDPANFAQINKALNELTQEDAYFYMAGNGEAITDDRSLKMSDHYHDKLAAQEETGRAIAPLVLGLASRVPKDYTLDVSR